MIPNCEDCAKERGACSGAGACSDEAEDLSVRNATVSTRSNIPQHSNQSAV